MGVCGLGVGVYVGVGEVKRLDWREDKKSVSWIQSFLIWEPTFRIWQAFLIWEEPTFVLEAIHSEDSSSSTS